MTMRQVNTILGGPTSLPNPGGRAKPPVRRGSQRKGSCEAGFWRRSDQREMNQMLMGALRYELTGRQKGQRNGPLGHVGIEVLRLMANLVIHGSGRLEPSYEFLMLKLNRSKAAVTRALEALREHGFLDWIRRYEPNGVTEGPGPRVRQATNAYRLSLPARAAKLIGQWLAGPPLPDDLHQERAERDAWVAAQKAALPLSELPLVEIEDDRLGRLLGELGRAVETRAAQARALAERESARQGEDESNVYKKGSPKS